MKFNTFARYVLRYSFFQSYYAHRFLRSECDLLATFAYTLFKLDLFEDWARRYNKAPE